MIHYKQIISLPMINAIMAWITYACGASSLPPHYRLTGCVTERSTIKAVIALPGTDAE
ncbi:MAG: hypothetical protein ACLQBQ_03260 [Smithella sp.]